MTPPPEIHLGDASWVKIATRRVLASFVDALARSHGWKRLYLVSPWFSDFARTCDMDFNQMLKRMVDDDATAYIITRPPIDPWHINAVDKFKQTRKTSIALVPNLHTKLFCAETAQGSFALMGSANMTLQSFSNREIGLFVSSTGSGAEIVKKLTYEAADIYRSPGRQLFCKRPLA